MAKLFPSINEIMNTFPKPTEGELYLINNIVSYLDDNYEVYFQPFLNGDKPDIIIVREKGGILVIEVKDWELVHYNIDRNGRFQLKKNNCIVKSPIAQVNSYKRHLLEIHMPFLEEESVKIKNISQVIQTAVYFHKETTSSLSYLRNVSKGSCNIFGRDLVTKVGLENLMNRTRLNGRSIYFNKDIYNETIRILKPSFQMYKDRQQIYLDKKQKSLAISKIGSYKIKGVAGSGKTVVLAERAANCYKRTFGKILILTFNITLKNYIEERIGLALQHNNVDRCVRKDFVILNYHQFIKSQANNNGIVVDKNFDSNYTLFNGTEVEQFDGIFVDEVQDFRYEWLCVLRDKFLKEDGEFVLFGDEKQNIYSRELDTNKLCKTNVIGSWNQLNKCYRLQRKTALLSQQFQKEFMQSKYNIENAELEYEENLFDTSKVRYVKVDKTINYNAILNMIINQIKKDNINNNDIAIIAPRIELVRNMQVILQKDYKMATSIMHETELEYEKINNNIEIKNKEARLERVRRARKCNFRMNDGKIKLSTIQSFKGWEIHTLFLIYDDKDCKDEIMYASMTRAINSLYIINVNSEQYHKFFENINKQLA